MITKQIHKLDVFLIHANIQLYCIQKAEGVNLTHSVAKSLMSLALTQKLTQWAFSEPLPSLIIRYDFKPIGVYHVNLVFSHYWGQTSTNLEENIQVEWSFANIGHSWWCFNPPLTCFIVSFTFSLHSPNGRHLPAARVVQGDRHWPLKNGGYSHVHSRYLAVSYLLRTQKIHPIAHLLGRAMGCLLWVHILNKVSAPFHIVFNIMLYSTPLYIVSL